MEEIFSLVDTTFLLHAVAYLLSNTLKVGVQSLYRDLHNSIFQLKHHTGFAGSAGK